MTLGLTASQQLPAAADVRVEADEATSAALWQEIATAENFQRALAGAVRELLAGIPHHARQRTLVDAGVTAAEGGYASVVTALGRPPETERHQQALTTTARFGAAEASLLGHLDLDAIAEGPLAVLDAVERVPTIAVRVSDAFRDRGHQARADVLSLLARLGQACDVRIVTGRLTARWLATEHRAQLPAAFSESVSAGQEEAPPVVEAVVQAREAFAPDSRAVSILRRLADEPGETLAYSELVAVTTVSKSRVSQLLGRLEEYSLVERYGPRTDQRVELRPAGSAFVDALDADIGRQADLDAAFSETGQKQTQCRVTPRAHEAPSLDGTDAADGAAGPYRTRYCNRPAHHAAAATADTGSITAIEAPFDTADTRTRWVSYNDRRDEVVVAVQAKTPLQYVTSIALSLASPRLFDRALPVDRLDDIDTPPEILRDARCIGGLSSEAAADGQTLRDALVEWGETLAESTTKLRRGEHEQDRDRFRSEIMRSAHGLAGTIVHLLDVVGVDVVRELRVPAGLPHERLAGIAKTVSVATAIQSEYSDRTLYRQVFEQREEKRTSAFGVDVDAADPLGRYIGGLVLRGPDAHRLARHVEGQLPSPAPVHEDAPEIAVRIPVRTPDRSTCAETVARMGREKQLDPTREAVTVFRAVTGSPYAVAEAIHALGSEPVAREICLDEVRAALGHLDADRLLPAAPPTVGEAVQALLRSSAALTKAELAEAADVSMRSIRRYADILGALTLVEETGSGLRFALPSREERGDAIEPAVLSDRQAARQDILFDIALVLTPDAGLTERLRRVWTGGYDEHRLRAVLPRIDPWIRAARALCGDPDATPATITVGNPTAQQAVQTASGGYT